MQRVRTPYTNFAFGEVSPNMIMRTDTPIYQSAAQGIQNAFMLPSGSVKRRPGLQRLYDFDIVRDSTKVYQSKLFPFIFQSDEQYIVSVEHGKLRIFQVTAAGATLVSTLTVDKDGGSLPFDHDYIHEYTYAQYGDVMIICHPLFMPRQVVRTSLTTFQVEIFEFNDSANGESIRQPYAKFAGENVTLALSDTAVGSVTLTTSEDYFDTTGSQTGGDYLDSLHVGVTLVYGDSEITITSVQSATSATGDLKSEAKIRLEILNPLRTFKNETRLEVTHLAHGFGGGEEITIDGASTTGGREPDGTYNIDRIVNSNAYEVTLSSNATEYEDGGGTVDIITKAPNRNWGEQVFSAVRGYPAAVCFHENRLCFGGTIAQPDAIWMSKTGNYYNFDVGEALDNDSIQIIAAINEVHDIRYLVSNRDLQVFTAAGELYIPVYLNQPITPTNAQLRRETPYGSAFVEPAVIDGATVFSQIGQNVLREYLYTDDIDAYTATNVSTIASHLPTNLTSCTVVDGAFGNGESYAVYTSTDSRVVLFNSNRAESRAGFCRFTSEGDVYSVCGIDERLYATAWFDTGAGEVLALCEFKEGVQLDCARTYTPSSGVVDVSADFENGAVLHAVQEDNGEHNYLGTFTVTLGEVDLSAFLTTEDVQLGFAYYSTLTSMPIDQVIRTGPQTGEPRGIISTTVDMVSTRSITVNGRPFALDSAFTGKHEFYDSGYSRDPTVVISQDEPLPWLVNGFVSEVVI